MTESWHQSDFSMSEVWLAEKFAKITTFLALISDQFQPPNNLNIWSLLLVSICDDKLNNTFPFINIKDPFLT